MYGSRGRTTPKVNSYGSNTYSIGNSYLQESRQKQKIYESQQQKVVLDQHYSNNILMLTLSTLESIEAVISKSKLKRENKAYGYYDKVNYDDKSLLELKSQLQSQLTVLKASRQVFERQNGRDKYELPTSFNEDKVRLEINRFKQAFKGERQILEMCQDFERIVKGRFNEKMDFETKDYRQKYSRQQEQAQKRAIVKNGMLAGRQMDYQKEKIQKLNVKNQRDLPIYYRRR